MLICGSSTSTGMGLGQTLAFNGLAKRTRILTPRPLAVEVRWCPMSVVQRGTRPFAMRNTARACQRAYRFPPRHPHSRVPCAAGGQLLQPSPSPLYRSRRLAPLRGRGVLTRRPLDCVRGGGSVATCSNWVAHTHKSRVRR
jgi:hypothetical protein